MLLTIDRGTVVMRACSVFALTPPHWTSSSIDYLLLFPTISIGAPILLRGVRYVTFLSDKVTDILRDPEQTNGRKILTILEINVKEINCMYADLLKLPGANSEEKNDVAGERIPDVDNKSTKCRALLTFKAYWRPN